MSDEITLTMTEQEDPRTDAEKLAAFVPLERQLAALQSKYDDLRDAHERVVKERDSLQEDKDNLQALVDQSDVADQLPILLDARTFLNELLFRAEHKTTGAWQSGPMLPDLRKLVDALNGLV